MGTVTLIPLYSCTSGIPEGARGFNPLKESKITRPLGPDRCPFSAIRSKYNCSPKPLRPEALAAPYGIFPNYRRVSNCAKGGFYFRPATTATVLDLIVRASQRRQRLSRSLLISPDP